MVATRPLEVNGLGLDVASGERAVAEWMTVFQPLLDERGVFGLWRELTFPTIVSVVWALAHTDALFPGKRGLKPTLHRLLSETSELASAHEVKGKNAHDARLIDAMQRHRLTTLVTFNTPDFARFTGINVFSPADVLNGLLTT